MRKLGSLRLRWLAGLGGAVALAATTFGGAPDLEPQPARAAGGVTAHEFVLPGIDGAPLPLARYRDQPVLVVNTASRCGFTGQYEGLQALWTQFRERGLVVIAAPSDDFRQELRSAEAVKAYCEAVFGVDFPMTDILHVKGPKAHPFFAWAAAESRAPSWNFNKYLIGPNGELVAHYGSSVSPKAIARDVETLLGAS